MIARHDCCRKKTDTILTKRLIIRVLTAAAIIVVGTLMVYRSELIDGEVTAKDTTMTFTTFVLFDMFNALSCRSEKKSIFSIGILSNRPFVIAVSASLICQLLVIYAPFFQMIFQTEALSGWELLRIVVLSSTVFWFDEGRKYYQYGPWRHSYSKVDKTIEMV